MQKQKSKSYLINSAIFQLISTTVFKYLYIDQKLIQRGYFHKSDDCYFFFLASLFISGDEELMKGERVLVWRGVDIILVEYWPLRGTGKQMKKSC